MEAMIETTTEKKRPGANGKESEEVQDLRTWLSSLGTSDIQVKVMRMSPKTYKGVNVEGTLNNYNELIEEDTIRDEYGGGVYRIVVHRRDEAGRLKFLQTRTVKIAGPPKIDAFSEELPEVSGGGGDNSTLASQAIHSMQWQLKEAREDAKKANNSAGFDPQALRLMQEPVMEQIRALREANAELQRALVEKDIRLMEAINKKPDATFQDDMLKNMWSSESARVESLRVGHESELRQLKTYHAEELSRIREQAKDDLKERTRGHEREIDAIRAATASQIDAIKIAYEARIDALKAENARLTGEQAQLKGEIGELRARKDKSLVESAEEVVRMQEAFSSMGFGGKKDEDDDSNKPWYEKIGTRLIENPEVLGQLAGGVRQAIGPAVPQAAPQVQLPPPGQPFQGPDGKLYMTRTDGKVQRLGAGIPQVRRAKAAAAMQTTQAAQTGPRPPDPQELMLAIQFMEAAASNGTDPVVFAQSARSAIPRDVLAYVEKVGIDEMLNKANLDQSSPLRTQAGRNFARAVAKVLLEGAPE